MSLLIHPQDKKLITAYFIVAVGSLVVGGAMALIMALIKTPALDIGDKFNELFYQALTAHAILMFVHWLAFFQAALAIGTVTVLLKGNRLWNLELGWASFVLMFLGWILTMVGVFSGASVLYTAFPPLSEQYPSTILIYLGYIFIAFGVLLLMMVISITIIKLVEDKGSFASWKKMLGEIHISTFATIMGIVMVIPATLLALFLYLPAVWAMLGYGSMEPMAFRLTYHLMFHIIHYIPAMVLVGVCYVIVDVCMKAKSVYGKTVAKALFTLYPLAVPPTFLYHLLVDPGIPNEVKAIGQILSLLVAFPTIIHMFIIMGMLEAKVKSAGFTSNFGWLKQLPWKNPAFTAMVAGMLSMGFGGILSYILLQGHAAQLLHGTFAVPAYIHPMAAGGATLIYMGASYYMITGINKRQLWQPTIARFQPWVSALGLFIFGGAGTIAGYLGSPRRTADVYYGGTSPDAWSLWMNITMGLGGILMIVGGVMFVAILVLTTVAGTKVDTVSEAIQKGMEPSDLPVKKEIKGTPISLVPGTIFTALVIFFTFLAFYIIAIWPIQFS